MSDMEAGQYGLDGLPWKDDYFGIEENEAIADADVPLDIFQLL